MNDINILTFWGVPNYGTFAQAYALQASIQKAYPEYDVKQINYLCQKHYKQYYSKYPIDPIWKKNFYKSLGKYLNPFSDYHKRRKNFPRDYNIIPHTEQFTASQLSLYEMDCLVLGSDIIWDYSFAFFDNDPYLFGNGLKAKKKVAYACSFGTVSKHNKHPEYVIDGIKDLNYISVRDENSADIVEEITGVRPPVVLDPTWLWNFSNDNNIIKPKFDNYIIVYGVLFTEAYKIKRKNNEKIVILASDGTKLEGHYYERKKNAPLVIFFHGFRGHSYVDGVPIYKIAQKEKWNVLLVSMRAHDESEGNIFTLGVKERYDCVNWANWAAKHFGRETPIFLMGISMGGAVVTMSSNLDFPDSVCGIIEDSGFTTSTKMLELNCKSHLPKGMPVEVFKIFADVGIKLWGGFNLKEADACKAVSQTKIPILIIHGDMDNLAPLYMAKEIYNSCKSSKEIYIVHGAGHAENYKKDPEGYEKIITTFIKERVP